MNNRTLKGRIERLIFGTTLDDVYEQIGDLNKSIDRLSARLDERIATIRKQIVQKDAADEDPRDGLYIVEDDCIGCQICTDFAPNTFRMNEDGIAVVLDHRGDSLAKIEEAVESCGSDCIKFA